jgi:hypothetical protein
MSEFDLDVRVTATSDTDNDQGIALTFVSACLTCDICTYYHRNTDCIV